MFLQNLRNRLLTDAASYPRKTESSRLFVFTVMPNMNFGWEYSVDIIRVERFFGW
jgi:hypothetical protein